jgi:hypothetical protein
VVILVVVALEAQPESFDKHAANPLQSLERRWWFDLILDRRLRPVLVHGRSIRRPPCREIRKRQRPLERCHNFRPHMVQEQLAQKSMPMSILDCYKQRQRARLEWKDLVERRPWPLAVVVPGKIKSRAAPLFPVVSCSKLLPVRLEKHPSRLVRKIPTSKRRHESESGPG